MKQLFSLFAFVFICLQSVSAQETYSYYYASYLVEGGMREMMVCKTEPFTWVNDETSGMSNVNYLPEVKFRKWLQGTYGSGVSGPDFYPCTSAAQAINYYKDFAATYQLSGPFKNSSYCSSIYSIAYVEPAKKSGTNTSTSNTYSSQINSTPTSATTGATTGTNETPAQRAYREQQERIAETQRQNEIQSKQFVEGTTELVGMVGSMLATNKADREKRLAKKAAAKDFKEQQRINAAMEAASDKEKVTYYSSLGDDISISQLISLYDIY